MRSVRIIFLFFILGAIFVYADAAQAVTVGPAKLEYSADPGDTIQGNIFIFNDGAETETLYAAFEKFTEVNGEKKFSPGEAAELANWFRMPHKVTLLPKGQENVPFTIEVPKNAPPGGHFAVIWWGNAPPDSGQVSIVTRAGILVYLRVSGDVRENGELLSFSSIAGRIVTRLPDFEVRFRNGGNTYLKPRGEIAVKNIFGGTTASFKVNDIGRIFLPEGEESLRLSPQFEKRPFAFGLYRADLSLVWGETGGVEKGYYILVLPWIHMLGASAVFLLLYFGARFGLRKYNERVIARYASNIETKKLETNKLENKKLETAKKFETKKRSRNTR